MQSRFTHFSRISAISASYSDLTRSRSASKSSYNLFIANFLQPFCVLCKIKLYLFSCLKIWPRLGRLLLHRNHLFRSSASVSLSPTGTLATWRPFDRKFGTCTLVHCIFLFLPTFGSSFIFGLFLMFLARFAYRSVDRVWDKQVYYLSTIFAVKVCMNSHFSVQLWISLFITSSVIICS